MRSTATQICCTSSSLSDKLLTARIKRDSESNWTIPSRHASVLLTTAWGVLSIWCTGCRCWSDSLCVWHPRKLWAQSQPFHCLPFGLYTSRSNGSNTLKKSLLYCEARLVWYNKLPTRVDILYLISATEPDQNGTLDRKTMHRQELEATPENLADLLCQWGTPSNCHGPDP